MNDLERSLAYVATADDIAYVRSLPPEKLLRISVVIPSYNQAKYLPATLDSVLGQNYPALEIFIADGGSRDGSITVIEDYAARFPGLIRYDARPDGGHHFGVNKGINCTDGDIIAWINSDDIYLPETFWKVATFFYFNRGAFVVYGRNKYVDADLNYIVDYPADWSPLLTEQKRRMMHFCLPPQPSLFFRRHAVTLCGALASKILDYELWLRWQDNLPFYFYDDYLSLSRLHDEAITVNADITLLKGICDVVYEYYGIVPYSWVFTLEYNRKYGAAWARRESPPISRAVHMRARLHWLYLNLRYFPRTVYRGLGKLARILREGLRTSA